MIELIKYVIGSFAEQPDKVDYDVVEEGKNINVISMPMMDVFEKQTKKYQKYILKSGTTKTISLEMLSTYGWGKYAKYNIGIDSFGKSGKASDVIESYGFDIESIMIKLNKIVK